MRTKLRPVTTSRRYLEAESGLKTEENDATQIVARELSCYFEEIKMGNHDICFGKFGMFLGERRRNTLCRP